MYDNMEIGMKDCKLKIGFESVDTCVNYLTRGTIYVHYIIKRYDGINAIKVYDIESIERGNAANFIYEQMECELGYELTRKHIRTYMDGNTWFAVYDDFVDLQSSTCGYGDTEQEAVKMLTGLNTIGDEE